MTKKTLFLFFVFFFAQLGHAMADDSLTTTYGELTCGDSKLFAKQTREIPAASDLPLLYVSQSIILAAPNSPPVELTIDRGLPVRLGDDYLAMQAIISSWQCVQGIKQKYILLSFYCAQNDYRAAGDLGGVCHGQKEWLRILDTGGTRMDKGYVPQDKRYNALYQKLGIDMHNGVSLLDTTPLSTPPSDWPANISH